MPPIRLGMKNTVRNRLVPFSFLVSSRATVRANTFISRVEIRVKRTVSQKDS